MKLFTFKKGVHPPHGKHLTEDKPIETLLPKGDLIFSMSQHIGAPCKPLVKKGDAVLVGQKIGDSEAFVSAPIFSSVSGTVKNVISLPQTNGNKATCVVVENDHKYEEIKREVSDYKNLSKKELVDMIKNNGIVGMGGACFPTHIKLSPPDDSKIDYIIINGAECEPYLTCDHRMMMEKTEEIIEGLRILLHMFPNVKVYIGIENNKMNAIEKFEKATAEEPKIEVTPLKTKYPQGAEKQLIYATTGREVPSGKLPADAGCIVQNIDTVYEIYNAVVNGKPLTERVVTVTGEAIAEPKNLRVKIGTSVTELIEATGGFKEDPVKVISGGPMMGITMSTLDVPVIKGTSGILCLTSVQAGLEEESNCIRCGKCIDACPMFLIPSKLNSLVIRSDYENFEKNCGMDCIECGCCSFACPAKRHLTQTCREGKRTIIQNRRK